MFVRIAVFDPLPVFRHGIITTLREAGLGSEAPDDLFAWVDDDHRRLVLYTLHSTDDWISLAQLRRSHEDVLVVALLADTAVTTYVRALTSGAVAALPRNAEPAEVRAIVEAVLHGRTVLPIDVVRSLTSSDTPLDPATTVPSPHELEWLSHLSTGMTVTELADRAGYSERMMFRLLRTLYTRLRVSGRTEALLLARTRGWL